MHNRVKVQGAVDGARGNGEYCLALACRHLYHFATAEHILQNKYNHTINLLCTPLLEKKKTSHAERLARRPRS
jgi:hypothetical protein